MYTICLLNAGMSSAEASWQVTHLFNSTLTPYSFLHPPQSTPEYTSIIQLRLHPGNSSHEQAVTPSPSLLHTHCESGILFVYVYTHCVLPALLL